MTGTQALAAGRLELESIVRAPLVVIADPVVAASGPPATREEVAAITAGSSGSAGSPPKPAGSPAKPPVSLGCKPLVSAGCLGGGGAVLLERAGGTILAFANPSPDSGLFVWAARDFLAVVADPDQDEDTPLAPVGELSVCSGRLVVGAPEIVAAWGADVDTGDGSTVRARMHRGRQRLGLIVVAQCPPGPATVATAPAAVAVTFSTSAVQAVPVPLAG